MSRILITDGTRFLGPATTQRLRAAGHDVTALDEPLTSRDQVTDFVAGHGPFNGVVANLDAPATVASVVDYHNEIVDDVLDRLVRPLYWILAAALPPMIEAGDGAVVVPTSATALRSGRHTAAVVEYLLSPGARALFGAVLPVDGGWSLG